MHVATPNTEITPKRVKTLKKRGDFLRLRSGDACHTPNFILQYKKRPVEAGTEQCRIGYTVTTKIGNAVVRNRIKRRFRSAVARIFPLKARSENDYVLIARRPVIDAEYSTILNDLASALDRVHSKRAKGPKRKTQNSN